MIMAIIAGIVVALLMVIVQFVSIMWFERWVSRLPLEEQEQAWKDYYWLSCADTPEEQAMIMRLVRERRRDNEKRTI